MHCNHNNDPASNSPMGGRLTPDRACMSAYVCACMRLPIYLHCMHLWMCLPICTTYKKVSSSDTACLANFLGCVCNTEVNNVWVRGGRLNGWQPNMTKANSNVGLSSERIGFTDHRKSKTTSSYIGVHHALYMECPSDITIGCSIKTSVEYNRLH